MNAKSFSRTMALVLLVAVLVAVDNRTACASKQTNGASESQSALKTAQLQSHLMSFADRFVSILDTVIAQFESLGPQGTARYEVLELMTFSAHHAYIIAGASDPNTALLDMFSMITLGRLFFEEEGPSRYGDIIAPVLKGYRKAEADIHQVAALKLSPQQIRSLMTIIQSWRKNNPEVKSFPLLRFSNFAADRGESALTRAETPDGLFESVESTSETVEEMRLLAERSVYMATRMPQLIGLFGDLWLTRWMNTPEVQASLAEFSTLSRSSDRLAASVVDFPDLIAAERNAAIELLSSHLTQERQEAIAQLRQGLAAERKAALEFLLAEERRIEAQLLAQAPKAIERLELLGRDLITHAVYHLIALMLLGMVGFIAASLLIRLVVNKVDVFQRHP